MTDAAPAPSGASKAAVAGGVGGAGVLIWLCDRLLVDQGEAAAATLTKLSPLLGPVWASWPVLALLVVVAWLATDRWKAAQARQAAEAEQASDQRGITEHFVEPSRNRQQCVADRLGHGVAPLADIVELAHENGEGIEGNQHEPGESHRGQHGEPNQLIDALD